MTFAFISPKLDLYGRRAGIDDTATIGRKNLLFVQKISAASAYPRREVL
jgi:hypothetical protein